MKSYFQLKALGAEPGSSWMLSRPPAVALRLCRPQEFYPPQEAKLSSHGWESQSREEPDVGGQLSDCQAQQSGGGSGELWMDRFGCGEGWTSACDLVKLR